MSLRPVLLLGLPVVLAACGGTPPAPPAVPAAPPPVSSARPEPAPAGVLAQAPELPRPEVPAYETRGRRDPFEVLETREGAGGTTVNSAKLAGIVHGENGPMALIETSEGLGYILRPGDTLGDGRLVEIFADSVVFNVATKRGVMSNRVVLKLPGDS